MSGKLSWELSGNHHTHGEADAKSSFYENHSFWIYFTYTAQYGTIHSCLEPILQSQATWSNPTKSSSSGLQTSWGLQSGLWWTRCASGSGCTWLFRRARVGGRVLVVFSIWIVCRGQLCIRGHGLIWALGYGRQGHHRLHKPTEDNTCNTQSCHNKMFLIRWLVFSAAAPKTPFPMAGRSAQMWKCWPCLHLSNLPSIALAQSGTFCYPSFNHHLYVIVSMAQFVSVVGDTLAG